MSSTIQVVCPHCHAANRLPVTRLQDKPGCGKCKHPLFPGKPVDLNSGNFARHINKSDIPVVVDFWAPWCGPCKMMAPAFSQTAAQLEPHFRFAKVNTEDEQQLASQFGIRSIPTLAVFRNGKEIARQAGAMDAGTLAQWVQQFR